VPILVSLSSLDAGQRPTVGGVIRESAHSILKTEAGITAMAYTTFAQYQAQINVQTITPTDKPPFAVIRIGAMDVYLDDEELDKLSTILALRINEVKQLRAVDAAISGKVWDRD
jgi:hypothetical protein